MDIILTCRKCDKRTILFGADMKAARGFIDGHKDHFGCKESDIEVDVH